MTDHMADDPPAAPAEAKPARRTRRQWRELEAELAEALALLERSDIEIAGLRDRLDIERTLVVVGDSSRAKLAREVTLADGRAFGASIGLVILAAMVVLLSVLTVLR